MKQFIEEFPQLNACSVDEQQEAFAFFQKTKEIRSFIERSRQAALNLQPGLAHEKILKVQSLLETLI